MAHFEYSCPVLFLGQVFANFQPRQIFKLFFFHRLLSYVSVGSQQYRGAIKFFYWLIACLNIVIDDCQLNYIEKLDCKIKIINVFNFSIKETHTLSLFLILIQSLEGADMGQLLAATVNQHPPAHHPLDA